jgi:hypothetical protein
VSMGNDVTAAWTVEGVASVSTCEYAAGVRTVEGVAFLRTSDNAASVKTVEQIRLLIARPAGSARLPMLAW